MRSTASAASLHAQCVDIQISRAISDVAGRAPQGSQTSGECNPALYGKYTSYDDLKTRVRNAFHARGVLLPGDPQPSRPVSNGPCRDPWINQAIASLGGRPQGTDMYGECDPKLYNGGTWSSYPELLSAVQATRRDLSANRLIWRAVDGNGQTAIALLDGTQNNAVVGGYLVSGSTVISRDPARIIGAGAGNIIGAGAGNIIGAGAGNFHTLGAAKRVVRLSNGKSLLVIE